MSPELESETLPPPESAPEKQLRFPLVYLFYGMAVLAISLATFGVWGIFIAIVVMATWAFVFASSSRPNAFVYVFATVLALLIYFALLPAVQTSREASRKMECNNNLRQLAIALHNYHEKYNSFPPAYVPDANGKPMHSWRVLILPFIEQEPIYKKYNFQEPWNGPNNSKFALSCPQEFQCPCQTANSRASGQAAYFSVVGPQTMWPGASCTNFDDITDGSTKTLMLIESHDVSANWLEPRDLSAAEAVALLSEEHSPHRATHPVENFFYEYSRQGRMVALADGSTHYVAGLLRVPAAEALVARADGQTFSYDELHGEGALAGVRPNYANWFRLGCFVVIVFFPLPWAWIHPRGIARRKVARTTE